MIRRAIAVLGLALLAGPAAALTPFVARYEVWVDGKRQGVSQMRLTDLGNGLWRHEIEAEGTAGMARLLDAELQQSSEFRLVDARPQPQQARQRMASLLREREVITHFDWQRGEARWSGDVKPDRRGPLPLSADAITDALLNLCLGLDCNQPAGTWLRYQRYERGKAMPVAYRIGARETIRVPLGERSAVPLRWQDDGGKRTTTAWYAADLPPTPLRVQREEDGRVRYELRLLEVAR